jgi:cytoskeletal protein CcmA (bactofilin family)
LIKLENILNAAIRKENFCIPKEMVINGSFQSETSGQVAGTVNGDVLVKGRIVILKDGFINGDISADEITVYGRISGDVRHCSKIIIHSGAIVNGSITAEEIHTEKETIIEGLIVKPGMPVAEKRKEPKLASSSSISDIDKPVQENSQLKEQASWF